MISRRHLLLGFSAIAPGLLANLLRPGLANALSIGGVVPPVNQPAPDFRLPTNSSLGSITLSDYRGQWVVLYFYPKDFTSGCTLEAQRFQQDLPEYLARNAQVIGVSVDNVDSHVAFCDSEGLTFPLLSDVDGNVSRAYGSWYAFGALRHTFLIDPDGILRERFLEVNPITHSAEVLAILDRLQDNT